MGRGGGGMAKIIGLSIGANSQSKLNLFMRFMALYAYTGFKPFSR